MQLKQFRARQGRDKCHSRNSQMSHARGEEAAEDLGKLSTAKSCPLSCKLTGRQAVCNSVRSTLTGPPCQTVYQKASKMQAGTSCLAMSPVFCRGQSSARCQNMLNARHSGMVTHTQRPGAMRCPQSPSRRSSMSVHAAAASAGGEDPYKVMQRSSASINKAIASIAADQACESGSNESADRDFAGVGSLQGCRL